MEVNKIHHIDCLEFMKSLPDNSINIIYSDPPYNMGSKYVFDKEGHYRFKSKSSGSDYMNLWEAQDGLWWSMYYEQAMRILKPGGYIIFHNIDRESDLWTYYARRTGFRVEQKLYWLFLNGMIKGNDASLFIDKEFGTEADRKPISSRMAQNFKGNPIGNATGTALYVKTSPASKLAWDYYGYRYGKSILRPMLEEILVFSKYDDSMSPVNMIIESASGNKEVHPPVMKTAIDPTGEAKNSWKAQFAMVADLLCIPGHTPDETLAIKDSTTDIEFCADDDELFQIPEFIKYCIKPDKKEKEAGLESMSYQAKVTKDVEVEGATTAKLKNNHPTVKPVKLAEWVLNMFKLPDEYMKDFVMLDTFTGSGSLLIAATNLGIPYIGTELNERYHEIATKRVAYHAEIKKHMDNNLFSQTELF